MAWNPSESKAKDIRVETQPWYCGSCGRTVVSDPNVKPTSCQACGSTDVRKHETKAPVQAKSPLK